MRNGVHHPVQFLLDPGVAGAAVALVDPHVSGTRKYTGYPIQNQSDRGPFWETSAMHLGPQDQVLGVDQQMPLSPVELLGPSYPRIPPTPFGLTDSLSRGLRGAEDRHADLGEENPVAAGRQISVLALWGACSIGWRSHP
jgi:hypothetical protein